MAFLSMSSSKPKFPQNLEKKDQKMQYETFLKVDSEQINLRNTVIEYNRLILSSFQIFVCFVGV